MHVLLDHDDWHDTFRPIDGATGGAGDERFETFGPDLDRVRASDPALVWTEVDADDGTTAIASGFALVNRIVYYICERRLQDGITATVVDIGWMKDRAEATSIADDEDLDVDDPEVARLRREALERIAEIEREIVPAASVVA